ncbi:MAG TPA: rod-binding protein, partial [Acidobacteriota bacterium]|nr:rod-binding protein [Acidobacteriota bacterium]
MSIDPIASRPEILTGSSAQPTLTKAAQEFEALFVAQLLKIMRESGLSSELFGSAPEQEIYREMMDQEVARALVAKGGLGLARMLEEHLAGNAGALRDAVREVVGELAKPRPAPQPLPADTPGDAHSVFQMSSAMGWRR